ncbi:hypothetical protein MASR1M107_28960 [Ignavibacteriales bacterium]
MKLLIPLFLFANIIFSQSFTWTKLPVPTHKTINSISFIDSLYGFAAGDTGLVMKTTDGGTSWEVQTLPRNKDISDITFVSRTTGYAVALDFESAPFGTLFYKTTNGGDSWVESRYRGDEVYFVSLHFLDSLRGWTSGLEGKIAFTTNGGDEWIPALNDTSEFTNFPVLGFSFYTDTLAFAFGGHIDIAGVVWKTTNSGGYWKSHGVGPEPIRGLIVFDSLNLIGIGGDFEYGTAVVKSTDGGETWDYRSLDVFGVPYGLSFRTENEAWVPLGFAQKLLYTPDKGTLWVEYSAPDSGILYDIQFTDSLTGYTAGRNGYFAKYSKILVGMDDDAAVPIMNAYQLGANYPNPFNPATVIPVTLAEEAQIVLTVYDIRGRETGFVTKGNFAAGYHEFKFDAGKASSGIYFYKLDVITSSGKKYSEVKKMVLNR